MVLEEAYCINLLRRPDRWKLVQDEVKKFPKDFVLHRFNAFENVEFPHIGCSESHMEILKMAKAQHKKFVFVVEDDVVFNESSFDALERAFRDLPEDWDILFGGCYYTPQGKHIKGTLYKIIYAQCTHCLIYRNTAYDAVLSYDQIPWSIDDFLSYLGVTRRVNMYHIYPPIALQRGGYSDIQRREYDFNQDADRAEDQELQHRVYMSLYRDDLDQAVAYAQKIHGGYTKQMALKVIEKRRCELSNLDPAEYMSPTLNMVYEGIR